MERIDAGIAQTTRTALLFWACDIRNGKNAHGMGSLLFSSALHY
jgi:hypothetical protein